MELRSRQSGLVESTDDWSYQGEIVVINRV
jgi:hypothetical protein